MVLGVGFAVVCEDLGRGKGFMWSWEPGLDHHFFMIDVSEIHGRSYREEGWET